ncbi:hypothetical protein LINPERPRIM_LOCUS38079 [Linum perenne]
MGLIDEVSGSGFLGFGVSEEMESVNEDLFKRHNGYGIIVEKKDMKLDFVWAPYADNLTNMMMGFTLKGGYPDVYGNGSDRGCGI